jgi:polynucleotide 5'-kinase involved in rRNA processing
LAIFSKAIVTIKFLHNSAFLSQKRQSFRHFGENTYLKNPRFQDPQLTQVWLAIGVGLVVGLVLLLILSRRRTSAARRVVIVVGPSDTGKTSLFSQVGAT